MTRVRRLLGSLGARVSLLAVGVVVATALLGTIAAVVVVQRANDQAAARSLAVLADTAAAVAEQAAATDGGLARARSALGTVQVQVAVVRTVPDRGTVVTGDPLARRMLTADLLARLTAGQDVSTRVVTDDGRVLVEGRATGSGSAIVLAQRRADAVSVGQSAVAAMVWWYAAAAVLAGLLGWWLARRITAPLRHTAVGAAELAAGRRDVAVAEAGPREVREVACAVNGLARSLAHSEARQREFLMSVSHDLRTPLTAVTGYAEALADGIVAPDRVAEVGRTIGAEAARLERLVGDLLDLARLDAHEPAVTLGPVDAAYLVGVAGPVWQARCSAVGVVFASELPDAPLPVLADPDRLRQALDGLLDNALRATPAGRPVVVAARAEQDIVVLEVRDGGPGLAPEDYPVAFERSVLYERYRGVRSVGTGLGLAIVARIAERHGGTVSAGPAPEGGACFAIRLPRRGGS